MFYSNKQEKYLTVQINNSEVGEGDSAEFLELVSYFHDDLIASQNNCQLVIKDNERLEPEEDFEHPKILLAVSESQPLAYDQNNYQRTIFNIAKKFIDCTNLSENYRVLVPFEDGRLVDARQLSKSDWAEIKGFLDIQVEHQKQPKLKIQLGK